MDNSHSKPAARNLPLPRELRDQIYSHLLNPAECSAVPRRFHTNILAVNKEIGSEAAQYLHKHSTFVLVRYSNPGFMEMMERFGVPIVANKKLKKFSKWSFAIKLKWPFGPFYSVGIIDKNWASAIKQRKGRVLLLLRDLPKLFAMLRFHCSFLAPAVVCMIEGLDPVAYQRSFSEFTPELKLRVQKHFMYKALTLADIRDFLNGFANIIGIGYSMDTKGFKDENMVENLKTRLSPTLIWPRAQSWTIFEVTLELKNSADQLALTGHLGEARARYGFIASWKYCDFFSGLPNVDVSSDSALLSASERWYLLLFDSGISYLWLHLRLYGKDAMWISFAKRWNIAMRPLVFAPGSARTIAVDYLHLYITLSALYAKDTATYIQALETTIHLLQLEANATNSNYLHIQNDIDVVERAIAQFRSAPISSTTDLDQNGDGQFSFPVGELSASTMAVRTFDHISEATLSEKPAGLVGWVDTEHMERLTEVEKEAIVVARKKISWLRRL